MGRSSKEVYGASGQGNVLSMDPDVFTLVTDPKHPLYDRRVHQEPDEKTIRNMRAHGVFTPVVFYKDVETGELLIIEGRRRIINARELNRRLRHEGYEPITVPAIPKRVLGDGVKPFVGVMISANEIRQGDSLVNRAEKMARALDVGHALDAVAAMFGVNEATVTVAMKLLECCMAVRDAVEAGTITQVVAMKLAKLSPEEQRAKLAEIEAAIEGKAGHERSRAMRAVLDAAPVKRAKPTRKDIAEALKTATGERADALRWVLGLTDGEQAPEVDPRQTTIDDAITTSTQSEQAA
ncbi:hypothetical protein LGM95_03010 [Burkholderia arboris]|nr:hypothetical protein [Burkholderia arboris]MCA8045508.1 hypothetical protein [Burkholderia arboris]